MPELGDAVRQALAAVGVTEERVSAWLGRPCGCKERQEKLNALGSAAKTVIMKGVTNAGKYLADLLANPW